MRSFVTFQTYGSFRLNFFFSLFFKCVFGPNARVFIFSSGSGFVCGVCPFLSLYVVLCLAVPGFGGKLFLLASSNLSPQLGFVSVWSVELFFFTCYRDLFSGLRTLLNGVCLRGRCYCCFVCAGDSLLYSSTPSGSAIEPVFSFIFPCSTLSLIASCLTFDSFCSAFRVFFAAMGAARRRLLL